MTANNKVLCRFSSVTFEKDGFAIFRADGEGRKFSAKGNISDIGKSLVNVDLELEGVWENHPKFGPGFAFKTYTIKEDPLVHFLTRVVGHVTESAAKEIAKQFGQNITNIMKDTPERLLEIKGIGPSKLKRIKESWNENFPIFRLGMELTPLGITTREIQMIHEAFGSSALEVTTKDPYALIAIRGVGFKRADEIARKVGVSHDAPERLAACAEFVMSELTSREGHSAYRSSEVLEGMAIFLQSEQRERVPRALLAKGLADLLASERASFVLDEPGTVDQRIAAGDDVALTWNLRYEQSLMRAIKSGIKHKPIVEDVDAWIAAYEERHQYSFGEEQKAAIRLANEGHPIISISGYAGTGKTTVAKAILALLAEEIKPNEVQCCALAGIAAKRIEMQTGYDSATIHTALGYQGDGNWGMSATNPLDHKLVLLDESGMVDNELAYRLFSAIDFSRTRLIMLGDPAQVAPVGAGQPYTDFLEQNLIPNVTLTKIYRQSEGAVITTMAADVRVGLTPQVTGEFDDFRFVDRSIKDYMGQKRVMSEEDFRNLRESNNGKIQDDIVRIAEAALPELTALRMKDSWAYVTQFQVVTPQRKGILGTDELNTRLQATLNPMGESVKRPDGRVFRVGDRVVHLKNKDMKIINRGDLIAFKNGRDFNHETRRIMNGQLGVVSTVNEDNEMVVHYPFENLSVVYSANELSQGIVDLSYALTVHKTQGSEYKHVVMPITMSHYSMLNPRILYTGMTRAKDKLELVGQYEALQSACNPRRLESCTRNTVLSILASHEKPALKPRMSI